MPRDSLDLDALGIVRRLDQQGYLAYFVGGCVRDSLLGVQPKDFDVATSARPRDVKKVFRNCRLIGKRFTLAHVFFKGDKIIEVATFRQAPSEEDQEEGLILHDNEFGSPQSDAFRRDFTINALFYDPVRKEIIDYCGGMEDVYRRILRCIGEPVVRFREDPIRMLRAIKFAARLKLTFEPALERALHSERAELLKAARPRFAQELIRMLQGGAARRSYELLESLSYLDLLCPELSAAWSQEPSLRAETLSLLEELDEVGPELSEEASHLICLWWPLYAKLLEHRQPSPKVAKWVALRLISPFATRVRLSIKQLHHITRGLTYLLMVSREELNPQRAKGGTARSGQRSGSSQGKQERDYRTLSQLISDGLARSRSAG